MARRIHQVCMSRETCSQATIFELCPRPSIRLIPGSDPGIATAVGVLLGDGDHETQIGLDHFLLGIAAGALAAVHALVDVLELFQRRPRGPAGRSGFCCSSCTGGMLRSSTALDSCLPPLFDDPVQVQQIGREVLDRTALGRPLVHDDLAQLAFLLAHVVHLGARRSQSFSIVLAVKRTVIQLFGDAALLRSSRCALPGAVSSLPLSYTPWCIWSKSSRVEPKLDSRASVLQLFRANGSRASGSRPCRRRRLLLSYSSKSSLSHIARRSSLALTEAVHHGGDDNLAFAADFPRPALRISAMVAGRPRWLILSCPSDRLSDALGDVLGFRLRVMQQFDG